jgi:hypothetical protein
MLSIILMIFRRKESTAAGIEARVAGPCLERFGDEPRRFGLGQSPGSRGGL